MTTDDLVSVIIPVFNREKTIRAAVDSVLLQSHGNIEVLVVDDCSSDRTREVVEAIPDKRVRLIPREKNGGAGAARNAGIAAAKGDYIAFQDSDDLWLPGKLERQIEVFKEAPDKVGVVFGGKILYGRDSQHNYGMGKVAYAPPPVTTELYSFPRYADLLINNRVSMQTAMFKRSKINLEYWFDPRLRFDEDWEFTTRLARGTTIMEVLEPYVVAFISDDSISVHRKPRFSRATLAVLRNHRSELAGLTQQSALLRYRLGASLQRSGRPRLGRRFIFQACLLSPFQPKWWAKYLISFGVR
ncbi:glycosyltransferase family 2 protein [Hwanghaeella grinnelliae]|uniref:Glycosyltransferase family 2 protein n=1 Tax=Hwanghaeella grinnelliae TaxID=2500179 RepID=A0A3S2VMW2_9PROT|nr:glycosyltransferase family 2 protein [Hwanghaeella grinnelliae]RVU34109.1 glycosyltransferase family 2 protein [Hwanghaeella grinnelliae]